MLRYIATCTYKIDSNFPSSLQTFVLTDHSNDVEMLKTCVEWQVISLQSFEHFDIISVVCSVYNMENCDICFSACFAVKQLLF